MANATVGRARVAWSAQVSRAHGSVPCLAIDFKIFGWLRLSGTMNVFYRATPPATGKVAKVATSRTPTNEFNPSTPPLLVCACIKPDWHIICCSPERSCKLYVVSNLSWLGPPRGWGGKTPQPHLKLCSVPLFLSRWLSGIRDVCLREPACTLNAWVYRLCQHISYDSR